MELKLSKWGNSKAIRIPRELLEKLNVGDEEVTFNAIISEGKIILTKQERQKLVNELKHFKISINGTRPIEEAIVTSGGINIKEINPKTMESKLINGLYFAGEILDVDGDCGGFNLQWAWSSGYTAGYFSSLE